MQRQEQKSSALDEQLKEYIAEWRKQRAKEEEALKRLKEKQSKRKVCNCQEKTPHIVLQQNTIIVSCA
jgi:troponin T